MIVNKFIPFFIVVFCVACFRPPKEKHTLVRKFSVNFEDPKEFNGYVELDRHNPKNHLAKVSKNIPFAAGITYELPDSIINKNLRIVFRAKIRTDGWNTFGHILVTNLVKDEVGLAWKELHMDYSINNRKEWNSFCDSIQISSNNNKEKGSKLKIFGYNQSAFDFMEYDDLELEIKIVE